MENNTVEVAQISGRKVSVTFERKLGLADYGNVTARAFVEDNLTADANDAQASEALVEMLNVAKVSVYDTLGIETFMDDTGVIREKHTPQVSVTQTAAAIGAAMGPTSNVQAPNTGGIRVMNPDKLQGDIPADVVQMCNELGITAVWANNGQYGQFFKEAVKQGETPKWANPDGKAAILNPKKYKS